jgi:hypothetical protein
VQEPDKTVRALEHLRGLLAPGGILLVTVPLGYKPHLDAHVREGRMRFNSLATSSGSHATTAGER